MSCNKDYQTEIWLRKDHKGNPEVRITRRNKQVVKGFGVPEIKYIDRVYSPTKPSLKRLEKTLSAWINKDWASVDIVGDDLFIEPTKF